MYGTVSYLPHSLAWDMYRNSVVQVKALQYLVRYNFRRIKSPST